MKYLGNYLEDSGGSWLDNLYNTYEITIKGENGSKLKGFVEADSTATISPTEDWEYSNDGLHITVLVGWPASFKEISKLHKYIKGLQ